MDTRNPDFAAVIDASFARQGIMQLLGAHVVAVTPGAVTLAAPIRPPVSQQHGFAHAGLAGAEQSVGQPRIQVNSKPRAFSIYSGSYPAAVK